MLSALVTTSMCSRIIFSISLFLYFSISLAIDQAVASKIDWQGKYYQLSYAMLRAESCRGRVVRARYLPTTPAAIY